MAVLETFWILFKTDASDAEKGAKTAKQSVDQLESSIASADKGTLDLGKKFNKLATTAVAAFASIFAVTSLVSSARGIAEQSAALGVLGDTIGASTVDITNWGRAVENMGGDAGALKSSLRGLQGTLDTVLISGSNAGTEALRKLGVAALDEGENIRSVLDILPDIAKGFEGRPRAVQNAFGQALGLDEGLILLLREGEDAVRLMVDRQASLNTVTGDQIEDLRLLNLKWLEFKNTLRDTGTGLVAAILPALKSIEDALTSFTEHLDETNQSVLGFFSGEALAALDNAIERWTFFADVMQLVSNLPEPLPVTPEQRAIQDERRGLPSPYNPLRPIGPGLDLLDRAYSAITRAEFRRVRDEMTIMSRTPLNALGAQNLAAGVSNSTRSTTVHIDEINVETQATDAAELAAGISSALETELSNAIEQFDDGIAR